MGIEGRRRDMGQMGWGTGGEGDFEVKGSLQSRSVSSIFFFLRIYLFMRDTQREAEIRPREKQASCREPDAELNLGPQDHALSQRHSATEPPRCPSNKYILKNKPYSSQC